jgi:outer membrane protein, multidrug efflux system
VERAINGGKIMIFVCFVYYAFAQSNWSDIAWWQDWPDAQLSKLIEEGLTNAPDSAIAQARLEQSKSIVGQQRAAFVPSVSGSWSSNSQPRDALGFGFGLSSSDSMIPGASSDETEDEDDTVELFTSGTAALRVDVPLDVWGKGVSSYQAAKIDVLANEQNQKLSLRTLSFAIANAYYDLILAQRSLQYIQEQVAVSNNLLEVIKLRHERGEATVLDVLQQEQQVALTGTQLPRGQQQVRFAEQQLLVLMGRSPMETLEISSDFPELEPFLVNETERWLALRPDIRAAQYQVQSAEKRKYSAMMNLLPSFSIGGQVSRQANYADEEWDSLDSWSMSTGASVTLYQGGSKVESLRTATAAVVIAEETLRQTTLRAQQEIAQIVLAEQTQTAVMDASTIQVYAAQRSFEEAQRQYNQGLLPFVTLMTTAQAYQQAQINDLQTQREQVRTRLQSYFALGLTSGEVLK